MLHPKGQCFNTPIPISGVLIPDTDILGGARVGAVG
jgi:hypothetical protein